MRRLFWSMRAAGSIMKDMVIDILYCYPISLLILIRNWSMGHSVP